VADASESDEHSRQGNIPLKEPTPPDAAVPALSPNLIQFRIGELHEVPSRKPSTCTQNDVDVPEIPMT
jgi:hypothetical protein